MIGSIQLDCSKHENLFRAQIFLPYWSVSLTNINQTNHGFILNTIIYVVLYKKKEDIKEDFPALIPWLDVNFPGLLFCTL